MSPSLRDLRHRLSSRFDGYESYTVGVQAVEDGSYSGTANGVTATRRLVSTDLADVDIDGTSSDSSPTVYDGAWTYIPDTHAQRRVVIDGYTPNVAANTVTTSISTAIVGHLTLNRALSRAVPGGTIFESH